MKDEECVPVKVALQLMDTSSLGMARQYPGFKETHQDLQYALQAIVNDHHQGFNSSIGAFHTIMRSITTSQAKARDLRESLIKAKEDLSTSKPEVKNMVDNSQKYDAMLQTLHSIEQLQLVPDKLEARISEKKFLGAVELLDEALTRIREPDMMEIGALSDLRAYLGSQESSLADILVEELHNHLYLKSLYCNDRWKAYSANKEGYASSMGGGRALHKFLDSNDSTQPVNAGTNKNPEADSLSYIRLCLEALHNLGHLPNAIATVNQRLPVELFKLVDKTNTEVDQRHPSSLTAGRTRGYNGKTMDLGLSENDVRVTTIHDLLYTLYSKFEAVMEGYRVIYDVVRGITKRGDTLQDAESWKHGFVEVWQLIQSEMRSLLHDYLTQSDSKNAHHAAPKGLHNAIINIVAGRGTRDMNKTIFKLSNTEVNATSDLKEDQEDLQQILKASVPGLVSESLRPAVASSDNNNTSDGAATGHKLLIEPSVFNIGLLLPPSLTFLNHIKEIVPAGSGIVLSTLPSFLDDFLVNVFYPSLDDTIRELFNQTTSDIDAFHEDSNWMSRSGKPIMKGTVAFLDLITAFCKMLDTIPPDQAFGQLTIDLLTSYYDKCYEWYKELVSRVETGNMKASARWSKEEPIRQAIENVWNLTEDASTAEHLKKETEVELAKQASQKLTQNDLISDRKVINSLCILCTSMRWLAGKVVQLRHVEEPENFSRNDGSGSGGRMRRRWTLIESVRSQHDANKPIYLPMTSDTVSAFDGVVKSFQELATTVLFTLHAEVRCKVIYHLDKCMVEGNYCLDNAVSTPDTNVLVLNTDLVWFDEDIASALPQRETRFVERGLGTLMSHILVANASTIKIINQDGVDRMQRNILVLQQNLKNIDVSADLGRAARFYALYGGGMDVLIANAKAGKLEFSYDELKVLVELYFSEAMSNRRESSSALQARRSLNENLLALSEIMWSI
ncbi:Sec8 exocyst complex component-specific domain-containing protein [Sphaerosporella brunnea]|uniref:Exocyst complex component Sec8 n=1 Tax=Sphaerosporella brunnea TaxID=1250544 RepID=A0A5J5F5B8_9PEZI|nr:Sec8 exocyst complex component-specific domain-containing protein [Sphaerosporella brunnea]